jgi:hypothetical protein
MKRRLRLLVRRKKGIKLCKHARASKRDEKVWHFSSSFVVDQHLLLLFA